MSDEQLFSAFQTMWGPFPEPVMLVRKDRTILAVNDLAREVGIPVGAKCFSLNPEAGGDHCRRCRANEALRDGHAVSCEEDQNGQRVIGYWMPLAEHPEIYVHFGIGTAASLAAVAKQAC